MKRYLTYICLQSRKEGTAGYTHVAEIIQGLKKRGWQVALYEPKYKSTVRNPKALTRLIEFIRIQIRLLFNCNRASALYLRSHFALFPIALYYKLLCIPVIQEVNGPYEDLFIAWPFTRKFSWLFKTLQKIQYATADALIAVTPNLRNWLIKEIGSKPIYVIPNGANIDLFHPDAELTVNLPKPYAVFFGALSPWQGIDTILSAVEIEDWPENLHLVIAGDGIERKRVDMSCRKNKKVIYIGELPYRKIPGVVAGSRVSLNPKSSVAAHSETGLLPLKLFETLACGIPIVVTDFPGQADLVNKYKSGLVINPNDPTALAKAVFKLYNNPSESKNMGLRGRRAIEDEHSWDKRAGDTESVIIEVINKKHIGA